MDHSNDFFEELNDIIHEFSNLQYRLEKLSKDRVLQENKTCSSDRFLTIREIRERLKVSDFLVREMIRDGDLPYIRMKSRILIQERDLYDWIERQKIC